MRTENDQLIKNCGASSAKEASPAKEEAKKKYFLSGCVGFIQTKSYHFMSIIPYVQIVVLVLMVVDFASLIMLYTTNSGNGGVSIWVIIFYVVSAIVTLLAMIYLCATKPPKDIAKLMAGHSKLMSQFTTLNQKHKEAVSEQEGLVEEQKQENLKLRNEVGNFQEENTKLQDSVRDMKNSNDFLSKHSREQVAGLAKQINSFKEENELYGELNEQLSNSKTRLKSVRKAMVANVNAQSEVTKGLLNVKNDREIELAQREVSEKNLEDAVRQVELREDLKDLPDPPTHIYSDALPEPPNHAPTIV